jgi:hypothetical protein
VVAADWPDCSYCWSLVQPATVSATVSSVRAGTLDMDGSPLGSSWMAGAYGSNAKIRFQSSFMLITVQPRLVASSSSFGVKVPTLVSGRPLVGVEARDVELDHPVERQVAALRDRDHVVRARQGVKVLGHDPGQQGFERLGPLAEIAQLHLIGAGAGDDARPVQVLRQRHGTETEHQALGRTLVHLGFGRCRQRVELRRLALRAAGECGQREAGAQRRRRRPRGGPHCPAPPALPRNNASGWRSR